MAGSNQSIKELEQEKNAVVSENINLRLEVHHLRERVRTLAGGTNAAEIDAENFALKEDINTLEKELSEMGVKCDSQEQQIEKLQTNLLKMDSARQELVTTLDQMKKAAHTYRSRSHALQRDLEAITAKSKQDREESRQAIMQLEHSLAAEKLKHQETSSAFQAKVRELEENVTQNETKTLQLQEQLSKAQQDVQTMRQKNNNESTKSIQMHSEMDMRLMELNELVAALRGQLNGLEDENSLLKAELTEKGDAVQASKQRAVELAEENATFRIQLGSLQQFQQRQSKAVDSTQSEIEQLRQELNKKSSELLEATCEREAIKASLKEMEAELQSTRQHHDRQLKDFENGISVSKSTLEAQITSQRAKIDDLLEELTRERNNRQAIELSKDRDISDLRLSLSQLEEEKKKIEFAAQEQTKRALANRENEVHELNERLTALQASLEQTQSSLKLEEESNSQLHSRIEAMKKNAQKMDTLKTKIKVLNDEKEELNNNLQKQRDAMRRIMDRKAKSVVSNRSVVPTVAAPGVAPSQRNLQTPMLADIQDRDKENHTNPTGEECTVEAKKGSDENATPRQEHSMMKTPTCRDPKSLSPLLTLSSSSSSSGGGGSDNKVRRALQPMSSTTINRAVKPTLSSTAGSSRFGALARRPGTASTTVTVGSRFRQAASNFRA